MARILLVDDDDMMSRMMSLRLRRDGHEVDSADNGRDGIRKAIAGGFDLVLMDMQMPVLDGHQAVRQLRQRGYGGRIAAVTASAEELEIETAIAAGCNHFLGKPIGDDFEARVAEILTAGGADGARGAHGDG